MLASHTEPGPGDVHRAIAAAFIKPVSTSEPNSRVGLPVIRGAVAYSVKQTTGKCNVAIGQFIN